MHVVFDAFAVRKGSTSIALDNLLRGWRELEPADRLTVLVPDGPEFCAPAGVRVEHVRAPIGGIGATTWLRLMGARVACRRLQADALVSPVTASALLGTGCPRGVIVHDLRHELRPHQFSTSRRLVRRLSYGWTFHAADLLFCVSRRTRADLVRNRPALRHKAIVAHNGTDHVDAWPERERSGQPYALVFGQFANKNVDKVLEAWVLACRDNPRLTLRVVGLSAPDRAVTMELVRRLGIVERVALMPWLDDDEYRACFSNASLIVFPSDFEGFGLPAGEAMRLRLPLVVSTDPALAEITGGNAVVAAQLDPLALALAMNQALASTETQLDAARSFSEQFTWRGMAEVIRNSLVVAPRRRGPGTSQRD